MDYKKALKKKFIIFLNKWEEEREAAGYEGGSIRESYEELRLKINTFCKSHNISFKKGKEIWEELEYEELIMRFKYHKKDKTIFSDITLNDYIKLVELMAKESEEKGAEYGSSILDFLQNGRSMYHFVAFIGGIRYLGANLVFKSSLTLYNQKDDFGFTPLDYAEQQGHTEIVKLLEDFETKRVKK